MSYSLNSSNAGEQYSYMVNYPPPTSTYNNTWSSETQGCTNGTWPTTQTDQNWPPFTNQAPWLQPNDGNLPRTNNPATNWSHDDWYQSTSNNKWSQEGETNTWCQNTNNQNWSDNTDHHNWSQNNQSRNWPENTWSQPSNWNDNWSNNPNWKPTNHDKRSNYWPPPANFESKRHRGNMRGGNMRGGRGRRTWRRGGGNWQNQRKPFHWRKDNASCVDTSWLHEEPLNIPNDEIVTKKDHNHETVATKITSNNTSDTIKIQQEPASSTTTPTTTTPTTLKTPTMFKTKSYVCELQELASKNHQKVQWVEEYESGPAHDKRFSIKVIVGAYYASGTAKSKKLAKQAAAETLINQMQRAGMPETCEKYGPQRPELPSTTTAVTSDTAPPCQIKNMPTDPVSKLLHITTKHGLGLVEFTMNDDNGPTDLEKFNMKVKIQNMECTGLGRSKKTAKRNAAQAMLDHLAKTNPVIAPPQKRIMFVAASATNAK